VASLGPISVVVDDHDRGIRHRVDDLGVELVSDLDTVAVSVDALDDTSDLLGSL
jgi:hypothetical protein